MADGRGPGHQWLRCPGAQSPAPSTSFRGSMLRIFSSQNSLEGSGGVVNAILLAILLQMIDMPTKVPDTSFSN